ncbi:MAG: Uma2 family endonuclease [Fimbriimonadales bacterium]|nr:Uma2 family endonuclease [Fimbriimonadales bacterium]MDW8052276.1 Uma2 family endonuclease [Armatimonadota bacterium]
MAVARATLKRKSRYTEQDLLQMPDDGRKYELVSGRIQVVPTGGRHGWIEFILAKKLGDYAKDRFFGFGSSTGFRVVQGNIRSPDFSLMRKERLPQGEPPVGFIDGAPDLAVEIVLPSEDLNDLYRKVLEYFESGAQQVWLLFPDRKQVYRYTAPLEVEVLRENDMLTGGELLPEFKVRVGELFE